MVLQFSRLERGGGPDEAVSANVGWEPPSFTSPPLFCPKHCCVYRLARRSGTDKLYPFSFQALESPQALKRRVVRLLGDGRHGVQGPRRGRALGVVKWMLAGR